MRVALVADVENEPVPGKVVAAVQRQRQLDDAEIAGEMPAVSPDYAGDFLPDLGGKGGKLFPAEVCEVCGGVDCRQDGFQSMPSSAARLSEGACLYVSYELRQYCI
jgi:hypothetical protein